MTSIIPIFPNDAVSCTAPWDNWRITSEGKIRHCWCANANDLKHGSDPDPGADLLDHWRTSDQLQRVRSQIQQGEPVNRCARCYETERVSGLSFRTRQHWTYGVHHGAWFRESLMQNPIWDRMQHTALDEDHLPAYITIAWGNQCNSRCIMCAPTFSRLVAEDHRAWGIPVEDVYLAASWTQGALGEAKYQSLLHMIVNNPRLVYLKQNGGEPFIQPESARLVEDIVAAGKFDFFYVVNTNATVWNQCIVDAMRRFQQTKLDLAIEVMHPSNDYIRFGSRLSQVEDFIQRYHQYDDERWTTVLHPVPQALSVLHLDTLIDYCHAYDMPMIANPITNPPHHQIQVLPRHIKQDLIHKWTTKYGLLSDHNDRGSVVEQDNQYLHPDNQTKSDHMLNINLRNVLLKCIEYLNDPETEYLDQLRRQFVQHVKNFDNRHGTDFCQTFPELVDMYHEFS